MTAARKAPSRPSAELAIALLKARIVLQMASKLALTPRMKKFLDEAASDATAALEQHAPKLLAEFDSTKAARLIR